METALHGRFGSGFRSMAPTRVALALLCSIIVDSAEAAADRCSVFPHPEHTNRIAHWIIERQTSDTAKSPDVALHVSASRAGASARRDGRISCLVIQCIEQETSVYIEGNGKPMDFAGRVAALTYSADGKTRSTRSFLSSSDSRAIGLWNGPDAISFVKELHGGTNLHVEAKPAGSPGYKADFKIDRLDEAIAAAQSACHW